MKNLFHKHNEKLEDSFLNLTWSNFNLHTQLIDTFSKELMLFTRAKPVLGPNCMMPNQYINLLYDEYWNKWV